MIKPTLAVMAAGLGQRYNGLKQIDPVYGEGGSSHILLEYAIYDAIGCGFGQVVILLRDFFLDDFKRKYGDRLAAGLKSRGIKLNYALQPALNEIDPVFSFREKMGGTGHAALCFQDLVRGPFVIINADDFYGRSTFKTIYDFFNSQDYDPAGATHALVGFRLKNVISANGYVARGICRDDSAGFLQSIVEREKIGLIDGRIFYLDAGGEKHSLDSNFYASMNFWGFNDTIFPLLEIGFKKFLTSVKSTRDAKKEYYLPAAVGAALTEGLIKVKILDTAESWFGMTYPDDRLKVRAEIKKMVEAGLYPPQLWSAKTPSDFDGQLK